MKVYIVYDKRNGEILHKHRLGSLKQGDSEDTLDCDKKEVLSSYRGTRVPKRYLAVAALTRYRPRSSRGRVVMYDDAKSRLVAKAPESGSDRTGSAKAKRSASARKETRRGHRG